MHIDSTRTHYTHEYIPPTTMPKPQYWPPQPPMPHPPYYPVPPGYHWELVPNSPPINPGVPYCETIPLSDLDDRRSVTFTRDLGLRPNESDGVTGLVSEFAGENFD